MRRRAAGRGALDILICENLRQAAEAFRVGLREHLPADFPLDEFVGLVETSVGKMVPILPEAVKQQDPLVVWAEAYNTLPVDARAFRNPIPAVPGLDPKQNMTAYVERKSFIHNLGHAACAYLGHLVDPSAEYLWQVVERPGGPRAPRSGRCWSRAAALIRRFPDEFTEANQEEHIEDLLTRFANRALGDTIYRVGRDLPRKLSRDDRLIGALRMDRGRTSRPPPPLSPAPRPSSSARRTSRARPSQPMRNSSAIWPPGAWTGPSPKSAASTPSRRPRCAPTSRGATSTWRPVRRTG